MISKRICPEASQEKSITDFLFFFYYSYPYSYLFIIIIIIILIIIIIIIIIISKNFETRGSLTSVLLFATPHWSWTKN